MINRLTGNVVNLSRYADWRLLNERVPAHPQQTEPTQPSLTMCSPAFDENGVEDFKSFLQQEMSLSNWSTMISKQHEGSLPKPIMGTMDNFTRFLKSMVSTVDPRDIFGANLHLPTTKRRRVIRDAISKSLSDACEELQLGNDKCQKIAHFILADIEGIFPLFAGDVTLESVKMGHGGINGLDFFRPDRTPGHAKQNGLKTVEARQLDRLQGFYEEMRSLLVQKSERAKHTRRTLLLVLSKDNKLINLVSLREFSFIDAEHYLCKLYVTIISSTSTRTISQKKRNHEIHCHPVPNNPQWIRQHEIAFMYVRRACFDLHQQSLLSTSAMNQLKYLNGRHTDETALLDVSSSESDEEGSESGDGSEDHSDADEDEQCC